MLPVTQLLIIIIKTSISYYIAACTSKFILPALLLGISLSFPFPCPVCLLFSNCYWSSICFPLFCSSFPWNRAGCAFSSLILKGIKQTLEHHHIVTCHSYYIKRLILSHLVKTPCAEHWFYYLNPEINHYSPHYWNSTPKRVKCPLFYAA